LLPEEEPRYNPRNTCIHQGYSSVALIPVRNKDKIVGLVQLNDCQKGRFTLEQIELMETIAAHIGEALMRKWAEEALQESNRRNHAILNSITDAFISLTEDLVVTFFNTAAERIFKHKSSEVLGKKLFDIFPMLQGGIFETNFTSSTKSGLPVSFEAEFDTESCRNWFDIRVYPGARNISIYFQVITERIQAEKERERLNALNLQLQKSKSIDRMAGAVAHLFNNKLHAVIGHLEQAIASQTEEPSPDNLECAIQAAENAAEISKMMLTYLGQVKGQRYPQKFVDICRKGVAALLQDLPENVNIKTDLPFPGPIINADATHIRQILDNLLHNAWESFDSKGGMIRLSVSTVKVEEITKSLVYPVEASLHDSHYACLEVCDNGCGISTSDLEEIFSPFFSTKFTGRGLGLSVVIGLVQSYEGAATAESTPGRGSIFRIYLPISSEEVIQSEKKAEPPALIEETGMVLVVDDDRTVLEITAAMISKMGFSVKKAMDGVEALEVFQKHKDNIRLVLSDVAMPRMNGWETLDALRQICPDIPVILASGYSEEQVMKKAAKERPQVFLEKPFGIEKLRQTIHNILGKVEA
jgi:PAS domain S-box-containing protein